MKGRRAPDRETVAYQDEDGAYVLQREGSATAWVASWTTVDLAEVR